MQGAANVPAEEGRRRAPRGASGRQPPVELLIDGAALVLADTGEVLACVEPPPPPLTFASTSGGKTLASVEPMVLGGCLERLLREAADQGRAVFTELTMTSQNDARGDPLTLSLRVAPHPARRGAFVVTVRNVSAYGQRMKNLSEAVDSLRAQRDEWEAVARTVAHDVRSSLSALVGFINLALLESAALPAPAGEHISRALDIGTRLLTLTDLMVDNPSRRASVREVVELGVQAPRLFSALQVSNPDVAFAWSVEAGTTAVHVSPSALWSLIWSLASNCIRYRDAGRALHIELRAAQVGEEVRIDIQDNGRGVPPGEEESIFRPGRRGSNVLDLEGSGLGLHGVRLLAEKCGGRVWAEPRELGALFRIALPLSPPSPDPEESKVPAQRPTRPAGNSRRGKRRSLSRN